MSTLTPPQIHSAVMIIHFDNKGPWFMGEIGSIDVYTFLHHVDHAIKKHPLTTDEEKIIALWDHIDPSNCFACSVIMSDYSHCKSYQSLHENCINIFASHSKHGPVSSI